MPPIKPVNGNLVNLMFRKRSQKSNCYKRTLIMLISNGISSARCNLIKRNLSLNIAQRLNEQRPAHLPALNVCLQINISGEQTKSGINADEVFGLAGIISQFPRLKLRGLMTIAENTNDMNVVRDNFLHMQQLFNQLKSQYPSVDTLSMGMTDDMPLAINCGSTMVRIGTAIFGSREYK